MLLKRIQNIFTRLIIDPIKYGKRNDYDASRYWDDRLKKHGMDSLKGVGVERFSHEENLSNKNQRVDLLQGVCEAEKIDFQKIKLLEIGCGNGNFTDYFYSTGLTQYEGADITDALFSSLQKKYPGYKFIKKNVSTENIEGKYDVIAMVSVIQHIVNDDKFKFTINNIKQSLSDNGIFIMSHVYDKPSRNVMHVRQWSLQELEKELGGFQITKKIPFIGTYLLVVKRNNSAGK